MINNLSDFISQSLAIKNPEDRWVVYVDGENRRGAILDCEGETDYEAKEDAWQFYQELVAETERYRK